MIIQVNSDNHLTVHENYRKKLTDQLSEELSRFDEIISRLEVHMSDENGPKTGVTDKRCLLEARIEGRQPIAVSETADTHDNAIAGAVEKLKTALTTILGRLQDR